MKSFSVLANPTRMMFHQGRSFPIVKNPPFLRALQIPFHHSHSNQSNFSAVAILSLALFAAGSISTSDCSASAHPSQNNALVLYQYNICPFCNRVKAYLDYLKIPYNTIEVNPLTKSQIKFSEDYKKVPIAIFQTEEKRLTVNDSQQILDYITDKYVKNNPTVSSTFLSEDSSYWSEWSEKRLAVLLYPNITRTFEESYECFNYAEKIDKWNVLERKSVHWLGAAAMLVANGKIKKKYNIVHEREELYQVLSEWTNALGNNNFLHGEDITLPDLMVYGVLKAVHGVRTFDDIMKQNSRLSAWYYRVAAKIASR
jgi:microsomal prostaglandin-E synthase 2